MAIYIYFSNSLYRKCVDDARSELLKIYIDGIYILDKIFPLFETTAWGDSKVAKLPPRRPAGSPRRSPSRK